MMRNFVAFVDQLASKDLIDSEFVQQAKAHQ